MWKPSLWISCQPKLACVDLHVTTYAYSWAYEKKAVNWETARSWGRVLGVRRQKVKAVWQRNFSHFIEFPRAFNHISRSLSVNRVWIEFPRAWPLSMLWLVLVWCSQMLSTTGVHSVSWVCPCLKEKTTERDIPLPLWHSDLDLSGFSGGWNS